jgi:hypothetical protein
MKTHPAQGLRFTIRKGSPVEAALMFVSSTAPACTSSRKRDAITVSADAVSQVSQVRGLALSASTLTGAIASRREADQLPDDQHRPVTELSDSLPEPDADRPPPGHVIGAVYRVVFWIFRCPRYA